jgi:hypothetical protein
MLGVKIKCVVIVLHPCPGYSKFLVLILTGPLPVCSIP